MQAVLVVVPNGSAYIALEEAQVRTSSNPAFRNLPGNGQNGGYATDPEYANKLVAVAERLGLAAPVTSFKSDGAKPITNAEPSRTNDA